MLGPPIILFQFADTPAACLVLASVVGQLPFSFLYHLRMAHGLYYGHAICAIDNNWRRMDQSAQHVAQVIHEARCPTSFISTS